MIPVYVSLPVWNLRLATCLQFSWSLLDSERSRTCWYHTLDSLNFLSYNYLNKGACRQKTLNSEYFRRIMVLCWNYAFHNNFNFTFCHRSRWFHSHWRQSSVFLQTLNGLLYQRPADGWENKHKSTSTHHNKITEFSFDFWSDELTVDSPNTLIVFSWLLCSIFPPPRHSQSSPRASTAGPTFSNIWSANNEKLLLTKTTFRPKLIWLHDTKYGFDKKTTKHCWGSVTKW